MRKYILTSFLITIVLSGCDNSFEVFDEDNGLFAVHGVLQSQKSVNYIRVRDLSLPFETEATEQFNAEVRLTNLDNDSTETLVPIREQFDDIYYHNFEILNVQSDTEYVLEIEGFNGKFAQIRVKTPDIITHSISPVVRDCKTNIRVEFTNATDGGNIDLRVEDSFVNGMNNSKGIDLTSTDFFKKFYLSSSIKTVKPDSENLFSPLVYEFRPIDTSAFLGAQDCDDVNRNSVYITYIYYSKGLQEKVRFDKEDVVASTNRFGAVYVGNLVVSF